MNTLYTFLLYLALPFILLRLWWRGFKVPQYRQRVNERFGYYRTPKIDSCIWLHAVSFGETIAAQALINKLLEKYPDTPLLITSMTITGSQRVLTQFGDRVHHVYIPYDLPSAIARFLAAFNPKIGIIMETELWPNLFAACHQHSIPIMMANGRLSEKSTRGYSRIKKLVAQTLKNVSVIAAQSATDAKRFESLGAAKEKIVITGNLKSDMQVPQHQVELARQDRNALTKPRPIFVAASTHEGEENIVLEAFLSIKKSLPDCLLILVPRHPERFEAVYTMCTQTAFSVMKRSLQKNMNSEMDILLGDTMGEMYYFYALSDVAFVGGSLVPIGGHNLLEPTAVSVPIITGPHLFNTAEVEKSFPNNIARVEVVNATELAEAAIELLQDDAKRKKLVAGAQEKWMESKGALDTHVGLIAGLLG